MRAITRSLITPLILAGAVLTTGLAAHQAMAGAASGTSVRTATEAGPYCPLGTNWDDILQRCV
jgi:hypothetical protein